MNENNQLPVEPIPYKKALFGVFLGGIIAFSTEYSLQPILSLLSQTFNLSPAATSWAISIAILSMAFTMPMLANKSHLLPRKKVMSVSLILACLLTGAVGLCEDFRLLLFVRMVQGCLLATIPILTIAYINEEVPIEHVGVGVGIYISGTTIGGLLGRVAVSALTDYLTWRPAVIVIGVISAVLSLLFMYYLPAPRHDPKANKAMGGFFIRAKAFFGGPNSLVPVFLIACCCMGSFVSIFNYLPYVLVKPPYSLSQTIIGSLFLTYLFGTVNSTVMGRMADRHGATRIIMLNTAIMLCGLVLTLLPSLAGKFIALALICTGQFGTHSSACSILGKLVPNDSALASSIYMFSYYVGASLVGSGSGLCFQAFGWFGVVALACGLVAFSLLLAIKLHLAHADLR